MISHTVYAGYTIKEKPDSHDGRWFIIKDGCNAMPGAARLETEAEAFMAADVLEAVNGDGRRFWHLWRAIRGTDRRPSHDHSAQPQASPQRPQVTLGYSPSKGQYHVTQIRGNIPRIVMPQMIVRVGDWLNEQEAKALGLHAELTITRHSAAQI